MAATTEADEAKRPVQIHRERAAFALLGLALFLLTLGWWLLTSDIWHLSEYCGSALNGPEYWGDHPCSNKRGGRVGAGLFTLAVGVWALLGAARFRWGKRWLYVRPEDDLTD